MIELVVDNNKQLSQRRDANTQSNALETRLWGRAEEQNQECASLVDCQHLTALMPTLVAPETGSCYSSRVLWIHVAPCQGTLLKLKKFNKFQQDRDLTQTLLFLLFLLPVSGWTRLAEVFNHQFNVSVIPAHGFFSKIPLECVPSPES